MSLNKFVSSVGKFTAFQVSLFSIFLWIYYRPAYQYPNYSTTNIKHERLRNTPSPRLIFVGGSNLFFGLDSELIESTTEYHPINMGLTVATRLNFILNEVKSQLRSGDTVVLVLEYQQFTVPGNAANPQILTRILEQRPQSILYLNLDHWKLLLDRGVQENFGIALRSSFGNLATRKPIFLQPDGYSKYAKRYNQYGDLVMFRNREPDKGKSHEDLLPDALNYSVIHKNIESLNRFKEYCHSRNVKVIYSYPPMPYSQYAKKKPIAKKFDQFLREQLDIPLINSQEDMVFPDEKFIDQTYHMHSDGPNLQTQKILDSFYHYQDKDVGSFQDVKINP